MIIMNLLIFLIYIRKKILINELIDTIASISSSLFYSNISFSKGPFKEKEYFLKNIMLNEEYEASILIIIKNTRNEEQKYYYSYTFNISEKFKEKGNDSKKLLIYLIIGLFSFIIIIFIAFCLKYRNIIMKNKSLEDKINNISFSEKNEDYDESKDEVTLI